MNINLTLSRTKVLAGQAHDLDLLIQLTAPPLPSDLARRPVVLLPVVDVSGSMQGVKLGAVKAALRKLSQHLVPGDRLGLVVFETGARTVMPLTEVTASWRKKFEQAVDDLHAGSQTNLGGGILEAYARIADAALLDHERARIVMLTDGHANCGPAITREALLELIAQRDGRVSISAFGYGDDCDQALLSELSGAGGGSYAYVNNDDVVMTAFARELGGLVSTYASGVEVAFESEDGAPGREKLGDLLHGADLATVVRVRVNRHEPRRGFTAARVVATWTDARGKAHRAEQEATLSFVKAGEEDTAEAPQVVQVRDERMLRQAQVAAEDLARDGRFDEAAKLLAKEAGRISTPALVKFLREQLIPAYANLREYSATSRTRASSLSALSRRKVIGASQEIESTFGSTAPTASELEMEQRWLRKQGKTREPADGANLLSALLKRHGVTLQMMPPLSFCPRGWRPLLDELLGDLAKIDCRELVQIKEKLGTLRVYLPRVHRDPRAVELIRQAEALSGHVCENCGRPGELRPTHRTLCEICLLTA